MDTTKSQARKSTGNVTQTLTGNDRRSSVTNMKHLTLFYEDHVFAEMRKLKSKLNLTWKEVIDLGLKGGRDGK